jgi:hypothetical protein
MLQEVKTRKEADEKWCTVLSKGPLSDATLGGNMLMAEPLCLEKTQPSFRKQRTSGLSW